MKMITKLRVHKMCDPTSDPNRGNFSLPHMITGNLVTKLHYFHETYLKGIFNWIILICSKLCKFFKLMPNIHMCQILQSN